MTEQLHFHFSLHALDKEMASHSSVLAWRIPGTGKPGGLPSTGSHRVRHGWSDLVAAAAAAGKFGLGVQNEAGQMLIEFCQENALVIANNLQQHKTLHMDITRWSIPKSDWLHSLQPKMEKLYTVSKNKTGSWLWLRPWTPYCQIQTEIEESRENY